MKMEYKKILNVLKANGCNVTDALNKTGVSLHNYKKYLDDPEFSEAYNETQKEADQLISDYVDNAFLKLVKAGDKTAILQYRKLQAQAAQDRKRQELTDNELAVLAPLELDLDKESVAFEKGIIKEMRSAGTLTSADKFFVQRVKDCYRIYIGIREKISGRYLVYDRFGVERQHPLLTELRAYGRCLDDLLIEGGLTPKSRIVAGITAPDRVSHGNAHSTDILDIINGG